MAESEQLNAMRAGFDAWNRGDYEGTLDYIAENVIWRPGDFFAGLDEVYEGHEGLRRFFEEFGEAWDEISIELEEVLEERPGTLLVVARFKARGREGIEVDAPFFQLYRYDDEGLVREFEAFPEEDQARAAAGSG